MNIDMAEKWPEMVLLESFKSNIRFGSLFNHLIYAKLVKKKPYDDIQNAIGFHSLLKRKK